MLRYTIFVGNDETATLAHGQKEGQLGYFGRQRSPRGRRVGREGDHHLGPLEQPRCGDPVRSEVQ